jgi:hypothetical protein
MDRASTTASITIKTDRDQFFYWFMSVDPPHIFRSYSIIPGVVESRNQSGPMHVPGSTRVFILSDGTSTTEEILASDPPNSIHYRIINLTNMFRYLVQEGNASFTFIELPSGETQINWHYAFIGRNSIAVLILKPLVSIFWKGFMQSALTKVKLLAEKELVNTDS